MPSPLAEVLLNVAEAVDQEEPMFVLILHSPASDRTIMHKSARLDNAGVLHLMSIVANGIIPQPTPGVPPSPTVAEEDQSETV